MRPIRLLQQNDLSGAKASVTEATPVCPRLRRSGPRANGESGGPVSPASGLAGPRIPQRVRGEVVAPGVRAVDADSHGRAATSPVRSCGVVDHGAGDPTEGAQ